MSRWIIGLLLFLLPMLGCNEIAQERRDSTALSVEGVASLVVTIAFMEGAEPAIPKGSAPFELFANNLNALFSGSQTKVIVPHSPADLDEVRGGHGSYTRQEAFDLALGSRGRGSADRDSTEVHVLFLDGYLEEDGELNRNVIGTSVRPDGLIVIFKEAVLERTETDPDLAAYFEQMVMVHEAGHLLGLVGEGIPAMSDHHDKAHPGHCSNPDCIMFHEMEGGEALFEYLESLAMNPGKILFGSECRADFHAMTSSHP